MNGLALNVTMLSALLAASTPVEAKDPPQINPAGQ